MYKIIRFYQREDVPNETIATGLTLDEAQAHCEDPETSSRTATDPGTQGAWFDGYTEE